MRRPGNEGGREVARVRRYRPEVRSLCPSAVREGRGCSCSPRGRTMIGERLGGLNRVGGQDRCSPDAWRPPCRAAAVNLNRSGHLQRPTATRRIAETAMAVIGISRLVPIPDDFQIWTYERIAKQAEETVMFIGRYFACAA